MLKRFIIIRCDSDPEYVGKIMYQWVLRRGIKLLFIQPSKPQQNAYVERHNRTIRYNWLNQYLFSNISQIQEFSTKWL